MAGGTPRLAVRPDVGGGIRGTGSLPHTGERLSAGANVPPGWSESRAIHARTLPPLLTGRPITQPALHAITQASLLIVVAEGGLAASEDIATSLSHAGLAARMLWLRLGSLDAHPDSFAASLVASYSRLAGDHERLRSDLREALSERANRGAALGRALSSALPDESTIVLEDAEGVTAAASVVEALSALSSAQGNRVCTVVVCHEHPSRRLRTIAGSVLSKGELRTGRGSIGELLAERDLRVPISTLERLLRIAAGRIALIHDVLDAAADVSMDAVVEAVNRSRRASSLMTALTERLVNESSPDQIEALSTALATGYWHPRIGDDPDRTVPSLRPWCVALEDDWLWLRPCWRDAVARSLRSATRAAPFLASIPSVAAVPRSEHAVRPEPTSAPRNANDGDPVDVEGPEVPAVSQVVCAPPLEPEHLSRGSGDDVALHVLLLGTFEVIVGQRSVEIPNGQRGATLLKYLLTRRSRSCPRDVLMDVFWPDVAPELTRNRLQVALSALRKNLREVIDVPVVEFHDGMYRINPNLTILADTDEFERLATAGKTADADGDETAALGAYGRAIALYRGDLLSDLPYADWAIMPRETLRITYLEVLDRLIATHVAGNRFAACVPVAQLVLNQDPCREDVHRVLMRCYARLGRTAQALRQFDLCKHALQATLDVAPSAPTLDLHRAIRERSQSAAPQHAVRV